MRTHAAKDKQYEDIETRTAIRMLGNLHCGGIRVSVCVFTGVSVSVSGCVRVSVCVRVCVNVCVRVCVFVRVIVIVSVSRLR